MSLKLWGKTSRSGKVLAVAAFTKVDIELVSNFEMGKTNKTPAFLAMNPCGKVQSVPTDMHRWTCSVSAECPLRDKTSMNEANCPALAASSVSFAQITKVEVEDGFQTPTRHAGSGTDTVSSR